MEKRQANNVYVTSLLKKTTFNEKLNITQKWLFMESTVSKNTFWYH